LSNVSLFYGLIERVVTQRRHHQLLRCCTLDAPLYLLKDFPTLSRIYSSNDLYFIYLSKDFCFCFQPKFLFYEKRRIKASKTVRWPEFYRNSKWQIERYYVFIYFQSFNIYPFDRSANIKLKGLKLMVYLKKLLNVKNS